MKRIATLFVAATAVNGVTIFDDDHEFMKGFETGVMMRTKETTLDEFGCTIPESGKSQYSSIFSKIGTAMEIVRPMLPEDLEIETSYDMM